MQDCVFCKIIRGDLPSCKIYEDSDFIAVLDINPANKGHALVMPKKHTPSLLDVADNEVKELMHRIKKVSKAVHSGTNADSINVFLNDGKAAGQIIPHIHFHILPRFYNDGIMFKVKREQYEKDEMEQLRKKIAEQISD